MSRLRQPSKDGSQRVPVVRQVQVLRVTYVARPRLIKALERLQELLRMRLRQLSVPIVVSASKTHCSDCHFQHSEYHVCILFGRNLPHDEAGNVRLRDCVTAEWKARKDEQSAIDVTAEPVNFCVTHSLLKVRVPLANAGKRYRVSLSLAGDTEGPCESLAEMRKNG